MSIPTPTAWAIDPLPDFLEDHTLPGKAETERLHQQAGRWVQFVASLWSWRGRATFALRYTSRNGHTDIYFLAAAHEGGEEERLAQEVEVLLRAHRLIERPHTRRLNATILHAVLDLENPAIIEVSQYVTQSLWQPAGGADTALSAEQRKWLAVEEVQKPRVIYPWWGPGGPFLIPMESLVSQPVAATLTIYLEPTELTADDWRWLGLMAQMASSAGEASTTSHGYNAPGRRVDPAASLAGRLYAANLRRLSATPFLVSAHCCATEGRSDVARSLAGAVQALVHEVPFERPQQDEQRLPSGARLRGDGLNSMPPEVPTFKPQLLKQYRELRFTEELRGQTLARMPYLADAQGAATLFRLPVSVRGGVPGVQVKQLPPDFHPGTRQRECPSHHLELGRYHAGGVASIPLQDLTKHALITGFTGSGKTVTVMQLLHQLWVDHGVPFLVLESAKQEYRGLIRVEAIKRKETKLRVYTLGNELAVPFRLNPFELLPGVRVEAHLSKLQSCFEGAIPPIGPSSSVITEALLRVYDQAGWSLTDVRPTVGKPRRRYPILSEFVDAVQQVLEDRRYEGEVRSNLQAAILGRFKPLLLGGKGRMFNCQESAPGAAELFGTPVVLEMNDLSIDDKALMVMFLLTLLREHREAERSQPGRLVHVTVVEEAHNVLENVSSVGNQQDGASADTRYKAVQAFCSMLTEIRALGEGLIIADQSPEKLARDAIRNTNIQIAHQLRDAQDREAMARAMIMEDEQRDYLGKLPPGHAALFFTGLEKATFVQVAMYAPKPEPPETSSPAGVGLSARGRGAGFQALISDTELVEYMQGVDSSLATRRKLCLPFPECDLCTSQCQYRDWMFVETAAAEYRKAGDEWLQLALERLTQANPDEVWQRVVRHGASVLQRMPSQDNALDAIWCFAAHFLDHAVRANGGNRTDSSWQLHRDARELIERHMAGMVAQTELEPPPLQEVAPDPAA